MGYEFIRQICRLTRFFLESAVKTLMDIVSVFRRVCKVAKNDSYLSMFVRPHGTADFIKPEYGFG
jgi:hypothetical protein